MWDVLVVFAPCSASSILLFNPAGKTWEEVGNFEGDGKWCGCAKLPDGSVVFTPSCAIRLAGWSSWPSSLSLADKLRASCYCNSCGATCRAKAEALGNFPRYFFS